MGWILPTVSAEQAAKRCRADAVQSCNSSFPPRSFEAIERAS